MHAFLLINCNPIEFAKNQNAKVVPFSLQKTEDSKNLKKIIKFSFSEKTAIVINDIDKATVQASNAFLKNLEEPNNDLIYILTASNLNNVLPTIVSRCEVVKISNLKSQISNKSEVIKFLNSKLTQKFELVGKIKEREEAIKFVERVLLYLSSELTHNPPLANKCEACLQTIDGLRKNGNVSLQMASLIARMNGHGR